MRFLTLAGWLATVWLAAVSTVSADDMRFDLVAAGALGIDANDRCEREATDVIGCSPALAYPTLELSIEARIIEWLGVGAFAGLSRLHTNRAESRDGVQLSGTDDRMLRIGAEIKLHPLARVLPGAWVGVTAGLAQLYGSSDQRGALIGGSLGVDWTLFDLLILGVGARVEHLAIGSSDVVGRGLSLGDARYASGPRAWLGARVGVTF